MFHLSEKLLYFELGSGKVNWRLTTGICAIFPVLMAVLMVFMPKSPYFLIGKVGFLEFLTLGIKTLIAFCALKIGPGHIAFMKVFVNKNCQELTYFFKLV